MKIFRAAQIASQAGDVQTFTGDVIRTTLASDKAGTPVNVYRVEFAPKARTHWHSHPETGRAGDRRCRRRRRGDSAGRETLARRHTVVTRNSSGGERQRGDP